MNEQNEPLASEVNSDLKRDNLFLKILVLVLVLLFAAQSFYHDYKWSQFDSVIVETGDNGGHANYIYENTGGVFNGESGGSPEEGREAQGDEN